MRDAQQHDPQQHDPQQPQTMPDGQAGTIALQAEPAGKLWDQLPGEPNRWYGRFQVFLRQGPARTLKSAATACGRGESGGWSSQSRTWHWHERAAAWDAHQRDLLALSDREMRIGLRRRRLAVIEEYLEAVRAVLDNADLPSADQETAREWMPQMRVFLRDLLAAERQEFERLNYAKDDPDNAAAITADDLRTAQQALEREQAQREAETRRTIAADAAARLAADKTKRTLLVCAGPASAFMIDLAALRGVRTATGLQFKRLLDVTRPKLENHLRRERRLGRPVELLHLALHASAAGVQFDDGVADGRWLSERLGGVRIMLLAGCEGDQVGDWLGVIPHVITLSEGITDADAAALTRHFWHNIGLGQEPGAALEAALAHCPPAAAEYVVRRW